MCEASQNLTSFTLPLNRAPDACRKTLRKLFRAVDAVERFTKLRIFLIPLFITFFNPKILDFHFPRKLALVTGVKCEKLDLRK